jgi:hypothetical protein
MDVMMDNSNDFSPRNKNMDYLTSKDIDNDNEPSNNVDVMNDNSNDYSPSSNMPMEYTTTKDIDNDNKPSSNIVTSGQWEVAGWLDQRTNKKFLLPDTTKETCFNWIICKIPSIVTAQGPTARGDGLPTFETRSLIVSSETIRPIGRGRT